MCVEAKNNWMTLIKEYILNGYLPTEEQEARKVRSTAAKYVISKRDLYRTMGD